MKTLAPALAALALTAFALPALAEKTGSVVTIDVVRITGVRRTPLASIDVTKVAPTVALTPLEEPFAHRIADATRHDPF